MSSRPHVSVLMIADSLPYFKEALRSVLEQSYQDFELLILGSQARLKVLSEAVSSDSRIRIVHNDARQEGTAGHLQLLKEAHGEYLLYTNSSDILHCRLLEKALLTFTQHPPPQVVSSFSKDNHAQSGSYQRIDYRVTHSQVIHFASLFNCALLSHGGLILSRKLALQYPHDPSIADKQVANYEMISRMLYKGIVFSIIPEVLYLHRTPQDHFSSSMEVIDRRQALLRISNQLLWQFSGVELSPSQHGLLQLLFSKDTPVSDIRESLRNLSKLASRYIIQEQMDRNARNEMYTWRLQWRLQLFLQLLLRGSWTHRTFVLIHLAKRPHYFFYVETWRKTGLRLLWFLNRFALWKKIGTLKTRSHKSDKIYGE